MKDLGTLTNGTSIGREGDIMNRVKHFQYEYN